MLSIPDLEALMVDQESDRVERKERLVDLDRIRQAICAFANDLPDHRQPGLLFIGVGDDGSCAHLSVDDDLLLNLAALRSDGRIQPFPIMSVQKVTLRSCQVAVIEVQPAYNPPVRLDGRVWIRVGQRRAQASLDDERRLTEKRRAANLPFDQQPVWGSSLDDLDLERFRFEYLPAAVAPEVMAENQRSEQQQLASLRLLTREGVPTHAAIMVLGRDPRQWLPGAYVQFLRLDGLELTDPIRHQREIVGPLSALLRQIDELLEANLSVATDLARGSVEVRRPDYPIAALQQLARNAVLHRTYEATNAPVRIYWFEDRVEILSPGGPYGLVNIENFGKPGMTDYRNPLLAEAMKNLGFVQRFGIGIELARHQLKTNGNPELEFRVEPSTVLALVRRRP